MQADVQMTDELAVVLGKRESSVDQSISFLYSKETRNSRLIIYLANCWPAYVAHIHSTISCIERL